MVQPDKDACFENYQFHLNHNIRDTCLTKTKDLHCVSDTRGATPLSALRPKPVDDGQSVAVYYSPSQKREGVLARVPGLHITATTDDTKKNEFRFCADR